MFALNGSNWLFENKHSSSILNMKKMTSNDLKKL